MVAIKRFFVNEDKLKVKMAERKSQSSANGSKEKKKSRFQQKLEDMQRLQQEMKKKK